MSMPIPFDTTRYIRTLSAGGVPAEQAEAHASALSEVIGDTPVAMDADLALLKADILARVQEMFDALERRMNKRFEFLQMAIVALAAVQLVHLSITLVLMVKLL